MKGVMLHEPLCVTYLSSSCGLTARLSWQLCTEFRGSLTIKVLGVNASQLLYLPYAVNNLIFAVLVKFSF